jgi:hypothetical protein
MIELQLTADEANALAALMNTAIKSAGIEAAKVAVPLYLKLEQAAKRADQKGQENG